MSHMIALWGGDYNAACKPLWGKQEKPPKKKQVIWLMWGVSFNLTECYFTTASPLSSVWAASMKTEREAGCWSISQKHQRHSILLNIFPLRRWCERCRSSQQSRKSRTDSGIGNNGQNQSRLPRNKRKIFGVCAPGSLMYLVFLLCIAICYIWGIGLTCNSYHVYPNTTYISPC